MNTQKTFSSWIAAIYLVLLGSFLSTDASASVDFAGAADAELTPDRNGNASTSFRFNVVNDHQNSYEMDFIVQASDPVDADNNRFTYNGSNCTTEKCVIDGDSRDTITVNWSGTPLAEASVLVFNFTYCEIPKFLLFREGKQVTPTTRLTGTCPRDSVRTVRETVDIGVAASAGTIRLSQSAYRVNEDAGTLSVVAERVDGASGSLTAKILYEGETASLNDDFRQGPESLTWEDGESGRKTFNIPIIADDLTEEDETFVVELVSDTRSQARVTIVDVPPESPGVIDIDDSCCTIREDAGTISVTVNRRDGAGGRISVTYADAGPRGSDGRIEQMATADEDYRSFSGELVWEDGDSSSKTIRITVFEDDLEEGTEYFNIAFGNPTGGAQLGFDQEWPLAIEDVAPARGVARFAATSRTVDEGQDVVLTVERVNGTAGAASVEWFTETGNDDGTATADQDFTAGSGTLRWDSGQGGNRQIRIPTRSDAVAESDETFTVRLRNPSGVTLGNNSAAVATISDVTSFGSIAFTESDYSGREDADSAVVTLARNGGTDGRVSVRVRSTNGTAVAGSDYTAVNQVVTWENGDGANKTVPIALVEDAVVEDDERFTLALSEVSGGAALGSPSSAGFTIQNTTIPRFGSIGFEKSTADGGPVADPLLIRVQRVGGADGEVSVDYVIGASGDTAVEGIDYSVASSSGRLVWADQDTAPKELRINYLEPPQNGVEETLTIRLSDPAGGAALALSEMTVTFRDEGLAAESPDIQIVSGANQSILPGATTTPFEVEVTNADGTVSVGTRVDWIVEPANAGRFVDGAETDTDQNGRSRNRLNVLERGEITVTAVVNPGTEEIDETYKRVVFKVGAGLQGAEDLSVSERSVAKSVDAACPALASSNNLTPAQQDLLATCDALDASSSANIKTGIARLTPEEAHAIGTASVDTSDIQVTNVQSRINAIRLGSAGLDLSSLNIRLYGESLPGVVTAALQDAITGGGAGDELTGNRLGFFVNGSMAFGSLDASDNEMGLDFDTQGLTIGMDYRTYDDWVFGGAIGLVQHQGDFASEGGSLELSGTSLSAFATWYEEDDAYIDIIVSIGQNSFDLRRRVNLPGAADQFAVSSPDASELSLSLGGGLDYNRDRWQYGPYGRLSYTRSSVGSYRESASDSTAPGTGSMLAFESQTLTMSSLVVGGQVSRNIPSAQGVWIPQARLELEHRLDNGKRKIDAAFLADPTSTTFTIESDDVDTDYLNLGLGVSAVFQNGKSGFLYYESRLGQDRLTQHWIKGGFRLEF